MNGPLSGRWWVESFRQMRGSSESPPNIGRQYAAAIAMALVMAALVVALIWIGINWLGLPRDGGDGLVLMTRGMPWS